MYLGIDIGGTKTIVALLDEEGVISESYKFPTPESYQAFLATLKEYVGNLSTTKFSGAAVGIPAKLNRSSGVAIAFGNRPWRDIEIQKNVGDIIGLSPLIENDANLAGLSEAMLIKEFNKVLYVTVSTGIGTGFIVKGRIESNVIDSEGGNVLVEHNGRLETWEHLISGKSIVRRFGKRASEINDKKTWKIIAHDLAIGLIDLIAITEPDIIVIGGSVGNYFDNYENLLMEELGKYASPILSIPEVRKAQRPDLAVVYGCYDLIKYMPHESIT